MSIPPGTYDVTAERRGFKMDENSRRVSILPGSCAPVRVTMRSESTVKGQLYGSDGRRLPDTPLHHAGGIRIAGKEFRSSRSTTTDAQGEFEFDDVYPGHYYLDTDVSQINPTFGRPLPHLFYPGVFGWRAAERLVVKENESLEKVVFKLPNLTVRTLDVRVVNAKGMAAVGAYVRDGGLSAADERAANISGQYQTDHLGGWQCRCGRRVITA